ncbi:MAG: 50S ribosomal protein L22 [Dehalococcoidia bacterium]|jgi:large subunit ribosomal protein L22|nr:50S ribosomal protein L22 [Dehalococcoidia bacterium]
MEVKSTVKNTGISARKVRLLLDMVRGKQVEEALTLLKFSTSPSAKVVAGVVKTAAADAENNFRLMPSDLKIVKIFADDAPTLKRFMPRARGRADHVMKRSSHITVVVAEQEG